MWSKQQGTEFGVMLLAMGEAFNEPVSEVRAEVFCRALEDLPFEAVKEAAQVHIRTSPFFPKPADLRQLVLGNVEDQAEFAWQHVLREVRRVGWVGKPSWPDDVTERAALGLFGGSWRALCENLPAGGPELLGYRKQFCSIFGATARQALAGELGPSRNEARAALEDLKKQLAARGLSTGEL